jgi:hypothetical protein
VEVAAMTTAMRIKAKITPWDDTVFVRAFETARDEVHALEVLEGLEDPKAAGHVQQRLREAGYPNATVEVIRTADEAMAHTSHWLVSREG